MKSGTGFDLYARLLARYLGQSSCRPSDCHPGKHGRRRGPGGGELALQRRAEDGSAIAIFAHTAAFDPLLGDSKGRYDGTQFTWIGNMDSVVGLCGVWQDSGITRFDDLFTKQTLFGSAGSGTAGPLTQFPTALRNLLGVKIKLIQGYRGSADIRLAMTRGEVHGVCGIPLSTVKTEWRDDYAAGRFKLILQLGHDKDPALGDVPHVYQYAKTDDDRKLFDLIFGLQQVGRPFAAPPHIPRIARRRCALLSWRHSAIQIQSGGGQTADRPGADDRRAGRGLRSPDLRFAARDRRPRQTRRETVSQATLRAAGRRSR